MPDEVLTPEDHRPVAGFFGKLPATGDFVWRGLPDVFRRNWDAWLTRHVAPLLRDGATFPPGGLRFRLPSGGRLAAGVILPSRDSAGRRFPLSLLLIAKGELTPDQIDRWSDAALALAPDSLRPDALWLALDTLPAPDPGPPPAGPALLWTLAHPPLPTKAADPAATLAALLPRR